MAPILNFTAAFKNSEISWKKDKEEFAGQFEHWIRDVKWGLYVATHFNDSNFPIYDRNGDGHKVVPENGYNLKYGKFQDGAPKRFRQNCEHCHRRRPDGTEAPASYADTLQLLLVLDLTGSMPTAGEPNPAEIYEKHWNRQIRAYLFGQGLIRADTPPRFEAKFVTRNIEADELLPLLSEIGDRILTAAQTGRRLE